MIRPAVALSVLIVGLGCDRVRPVEAPKAIDYTPSVERLTAAIEDWSRASQASLPDPARDDPREEPVPSSETASTSSISASMTGLGAPTLEKIIIGLFTLMLAAGHLIWHLRKMGKIIAHSIEMNYLDESGEKVPEVAAIKDHVDKSTKGTLFLEGLIHRFAQEAAYYHKTHHKRSDGSK